MASCLAWPIGRQTENSLAIVLKAVSIMAKGIVTRYPTSANTTFTGLAGFLTIFLSPLLFWSVWIPKSGDIAQNMT